MPLPGTEEVLYGSIDSFVFCFEPVVRCFHYTGKNNYQLLCKFDYLTVGMLNEGPAIRLDEKLKFGKTYRSETYDNDVLTYKDDYLRNEFEIADLEVYIV